MAKSISTKNEDLMREVEALRAQLAEAESKLAEAQEVIHAIHSGDVDAVVVSGPQGDQVFTLQGAEYSYRALVEAMNEGAATLGADGTVLYCNQHFSDLVQVPLERIIGSPAAQLFGGDGGHVFETLFACAMGGDAAKAEVELIAVERHSTPVYASLRKMSDEPTALCMVLTDLTEHKKRDELIAAGRLATSILENAAEAIAVCDASGKIISVNEALEELCGFNPLFQSFDSAISLQISDSPDELVERFSISSALAGRVHRATEVSFRRKDGQTLSLLLSSGRITGPSGTVGCVLSMTDITERKRMEDLLREGEAQARAQAHEIAAIMDSIPAVTFVAHDAECRTMESNRAAHELLRVPFGTNTSKSAPEGERLSTFRFMRDGRELAPDELPIQMAAATGRELRDVELSVVFDDGTSRDLLGHSVPLFDDSGRTRGAVGAFLDVTEYKMAAEALRESEEQFRDLANSIPQLCWMANPDGNIFWYNQGWFEYTGTTLEQMEGWGWRSVHDPVALPNVLERWRTALTTGQPLDIVFPLRGADGVFRPFLTRVRPVKDAEGKVVRWFGTNTEISEQKQIEAELRKSKERLDLALEVAALGEWELNLIDRTAWRSERHAQIFGYSSPMGEWSYQMFIEHVLPQYRAEVDEKIKAALVKGSSDFETQISRVDGEVRWIWIRGRSWKDETGRTTRVFGTVMDITDRKRVEEALIQNEKLASVGRMASTIAHEINNPLETIGHAIYLASTDADVSDSAKSYLNLAVQELERVTHITRQTLAFHRENQRPVLIDLRESIDDVVKLFAPRLNTRGITVDKRYLAVERIQAAGGEIRQVISNLLSNSMDAVPNGGLIRLRVSPSILRDGSKGVRFSIADTGSGILPEQLKKIFQPFYTTKEIVGTGLGLWVTKQMVEKHGAIIRVRSKPQRGTVFSIVFPSPKEGAMDKTAKVQ